MPALPVSRSILRPATFEWWLVTLGAFYLLVLWDHSGLDLGVMRLIGTRDGFALRHSFWLETIGHELARHLATVLWVLLWIGVLRPAGWLRRFDRRERLGMAVGTTLALLLINTLKRHSSVSCPWALDAFGGAAHWVSHWAWWVASDGGPGGCFPGGHASSALAFLALAWPGLRTPDDAARWQTGLRLLLGALLAGVLLGAVQTLRGAHPPSHTGWTLWLCWTSTGLYQVVHERLGRATRVRPDRSGATT